jgi:hypothetical protein
MYYLEESTLGELIAEKRIADNLRRSMLPKNDPDFMEREIEEPDTWNY